MNVDLDSALEPLIGRKSADLLAAQLEITTVGELVRHYPRRYVDRGKLTPITGLELGEHATLVAQVEKTTTREMRARRGTMLQVVLRDESGGSVDCTFFNAHKVKHLVYPGVRAVFSGKVGMFNQKLQLTHPQFEPLDETDEIRPFLSVYPATGKLGSQVIARCVRQVLELLDDPTDPLPPKIREREGLAELGRALRRIHVPEVEADIHAARHRLVWDEALGVQLALALRRQATAARPAPQCPPVAGGLLDAFDAALPFALTTGQVEVGAQVAADLSHAHPMNRLVQGDVGAGKTIIALRAMLQVVDSGQQAAMLAPTEVLASQHARSLRAMLGPLAEAGELGAASTATRVTLLTGSLGAKAKKKALLDAQSGEAGIMVGTHALIQDRVGFADLGLVVVDEQHRFGVEQRDALRGRGEKAPHMLVMTATPIPRTVAMTVYGDLTVSSLRGLPGGRSPIATSVVPLAEKPQWFASVWRRVRDEVAKGHQAYVVFPRVGDSEAEPAPPADEEARRPPLAVLDIAPRLADGALEGLRLEILHGKLPSEEKDAVMRSFERGEVDVLLATTVIEVGVDVPNATAIVILDAERFGLSQLHQLRGRVGRGSAPGVCLLVTEMPEGTAARERLAAVEGTTDGFELARLDLELRREGDVLGALQSGRRSGLRLLSLLKHEDVIAKAQVYAADLVAHDPGLEHSPGLAALVGEVVTDDRAEYLDKV